MNVTVTPSRAGRPDATRVRGTIEHLLGLRIDLTQWYRTAERDPRLRSLTAAAGTGHDAFPAPRDLARLPADAYRALGFSRQKTTRS